MTRSKLSVWLASRTGATRISLAFALSVLPALPLAAQTVLERIDAPTAANIASGFGSSFVEQGESTQDNPEGTYVRGRIEGTTYAIFLGGCAEGGCTNLRFYAGWEGAEAELEAVNGWNAARRFGRAFLDAAGDPVIEMDVNLAFGVTSRNLEDTFDWWRLSLRSFESEVVGSQ